MTDFSVFRDHMTRLAAVAAIALGSMSNGAVAQTTLLISVDTGPIHVRNITLRTFIERLKEAIGDVLAPSSDEVGQAGRVVAAIEAAAGGVATLDGRMVDAPAAIPARWVPARAGKSNRGTPKEED